MLYIWPHKWFWVTHMSNAFRVWTAITRILLKLEYAFMLDNIFVKLYNDILFVFNAIKLKKRGLYKLFQEVRLIYLCLLLKTGRRKFMMIFYF